MAAIMQHGANGSGRLYHHLQSEIDGAGHTLMLKTGTADSGLLPLLKVPENQNRETQSIASFEICSGDVNGGYAADTASV